jgi:ACR3 family arsenite transporter
LKSHDKQWFEESFLPRFHPIMIGALLLTLVLIFAFQADNLTRRFLHVLLIAIPWHLVDWRPVKLSLGAEPWFVSGRRFHWQEPRASPQVVRPRTPAGRSP